MDVREVSKYVGEKPFDKYTLICFIVLSYLRKGFPELRNSPTEKVIDVYLRLKDGDFVCPKCLEKGGVEKALNVSNAPTGKFYCRNCGEEVSPDECYELLNKVMIEALDRDLDKAFQNISRFFKAIDKQMEN